MNLVDKLLAADKKVLTIKNKGEYESKRIKRLIGEGIIEIQEVPPRRQDEITAMALDGNGSINFEKKYDAELLLVVEGCVNPNLKDKNLQEYYGASTPKDLAEILFKNEAREISDRIVELGESEADEATVKN